ncbi:hypothetical protein [Bacillus cereus]|uniref:Uncharacterized protein n=1 Tax=Bacillus cereus HuA3-9 TaxID=1053205 RepID=R8CIH5_BACCE|nr:hypothetical protein [Bacillus cereus]EOO11392.1 hypothetical protein IGA_05655 [Bacillus cereus HuA3-9]
MEEKLKDINLDIVILESDLANVCQDDVVEFIESKLATLYLKKAELELKLRTGTK